MVFGTSEAYQALARSLGAPLQNAAFYHAPRNLVAAGSDLSRLGAQLQQVQIQHDAVRADLERSRRDLPQRLEQRRVQLAVSMNSETARRKALTSYRRQLEQDIAKLERTLEEYDRTNEATFQQQAGRTLALLRHEAFHAYLENYVYPQARHNVPRWLNEGLAQVFENGVLEADTLRVDVPSKSALALLQADQSKQEAALAQLVLADHRSFLASHDRDRGAQAHYAGAWGLAYYLTFVRPVLGGRAMDDYVRRDAGPPDPMARFEELDRSTAPGVRSPVAPVGPESGGPLTPPH